MNTTDMTTWMVLVDVHAERRRQDRLRDAGRFQHTLADAGLTPAEKLACISEEAGEVARCVLAIEGHVHEDLGHADLRKELVQVAALAAAWIEAIDAEARA